jgi:hypothetical protein
MAQCEATKKGTSTTETCIANPNRTTGQGGPAPQQQQPLPQPAPRE